jgi:hypothetical protein
MPRAVVTTQPITRDGLEPVYTAAPLAGIAFVNQGERDFVHVKNGGVGAIVVTIQTAAVFDGLALADKTINIPAGEERFVGPFTMGIYNQSADASVYVDFDVVTSVTVAVLKL